MADDIDTFNVSSGAAWAVLFSVLIFFTILAAGSTDMIPGIPDGLKGLCLLKKKGDDAHTVDYFLSARNSAGFLAIALSFFASGMGAWVVYGTTQMGATPQLSWLGVIGYSGASAFPAIIICILGPSIRERSNNAFSTTDFGRDRYGRVMQVSIAIISVFYMFIYITAELTTIGGVFALLTNQTATAFVVGVTVVMGFFTLLYTGFAGLPASIVTDRYQGVIMALLVLILTIAVCTFEENDITKEEWDAAANWTTEGLMAMVTLFIAIACAEMFNQANWQRVWAAEDVPALRKGFALGSVMVFLLMMFFGIMGMIAYAKDPEAYDNFEKLSFLSFFDLLLPMGDGWHIVVLIFTTALAASSIDSLQNGLTSIFYHDLVKVGWNPRILTRTLVAVVNIPAIYWASRQPYVIDLFLIADLVCATAVFPTFLGLQETDKLGGLLPAPTELGAFLGILSGIATVLVNGVINDAEGGVFQYFWLRNGALCSLCGSKTMVSFILTPIIAGVMTYVFTHLDLLTRGERARSPIFDIAFDKKDGEVTVYNDETAVVEDSIGKSSNENGIEKPVVEPDQLSGKDAESAGESSEEPIKLDVVASSSVEEEA